MQDTPRHQGMRNRLVETLQKKGIQQAEVLRAIGEIPRHLFMDSALESHAYEDKPFPIGAGQTISQPYTVAFQTELLQVSKGDKVLEIGTGSGYQAAVLIAMGVEVYTIERQNELYKKALVMLPKLGYKPKKMKFGDGYQGWEEYAPYDGIVVTAGAPYVPKALLEQLKVGGTLVIPVGEKIQIMTVYKRTSKSEFVKKEFGDFRFVPLLEDKE
jgi:protein-L-isoaspartate(D-aspartate) O-methyltransferase